MNSAAEVISEVPLVSAPEYQNFGTATVQGTGATAYNSRAAVARDLRRALNVFIAIIALVIGAPLMLIIAVLVKLTSPGPVIYKQTRVGIDRRTDADDARWR